MASVLRLRISSQSPTGVSDVEAIVPESTPDAEIIDALGAGDAPASGLVNGSWLGASHQSDRLAPAGPVLIGISGPDSGLVKSLREGKPMKVGRAVSADDGLRVSDDPSRSSAHFEVTARGTRFEVRDLGSRNGTAVEGHRLADGEVRNIRPGELIEAGRSAFRVDLIREQLDRPDPSRPLDSVQQAASAE